LFNVRGRISITNSARGRRRRRRRNKQQQPNHLQGPFRLNNNTSRSLPPNNLELKATNKNHGLPINNETLPTNPLHHHPALPQPAKLLHSPAGREPHQLRLDGARQSPVPIHVTGALRHHRIQSSADPWHRSFNTTSGEQQQQSDSGSEDELGGLRPSA